MGFKQTCIAQCISAEMSSVSVQVWHLSRHTVILLSICTINHCNFITYLRVYSIFRTAQQQKSHQPWFSVPFIIFLCSRENLISYGRLIVNLQVSSHQLCLELLFFLNSNNFLHVIISVIYVHLTSHMLNCTLNISPSYLTFQLGSSLGPFRCQIYIRK